jgi:hypothetical protein
MVLLLWRSCRDVGWCGMCGWTVVVGEWLLLALIMKTMHRLWENLETMHCDLLATLDCLSLATTFNLQQHNICMIRTCDGNILITTSTGQMTDSAFQLQHLRLFHLHNRKSQQDEWQSRKA